MMVTTTYLRVMRLKFGISLLELEQHCSFSNQYLSMLELGRVKSTSNNEEVLKGAIAEIIASRKQSLDALTQSFEAHRGHLLETLEVEADEL